MALKVVVDTSAYSAFTRGHEGVADRIRAASELVLSVVVVAELSAGFRRGTRVDENLARLDRFRSNPRVVVAGVGWTTADRFARVVSDLRRAGTPIPTNDVWIAAQAFELGAEVLTLDGDFCRVPGLPVTLLRP